jgi:hypothetical protein
MNERICFLHVGTGKTGSSTFQYALAANCDDLLSRGYSFPDIGTNFQRMKKGRPTNGNGSRVGGALYKSNVKAATAVVRRFRSEPHHLILSNEALYKAPGPAMREFCDAIREMGYLVKCLVIFRPHTEMAVSAFVQYVKSRHYDGVTDLARYVRYRGYGSGRNWLAYAEHLEQAVGRENLTVRWLPAIRRSGGIIQTGFKWLGLPPPAIEIPDINPTVGLEAYIIVHMLRSANLCGRSVLDDLILRAQEEGLLGAPIVLDYELALEIHEHTKKSNAALLQRYCPGLSAEEELKPPQPRVEATPDLGKVRQLAMIAEQMLVARGVDGDAVRQAFRGLR